MMLEFFMHYELCCPATGEVVLAEGFGDRLDALRRAYGKPMMVNSCCRSAEHNRKIKGHPRSLHVWDEPYHDTGGTCAIDIHMTDAQLRAELVRLALDAGWSVGVARTFLHLDRRSDYLDLPQVVYTYA